MKINNLFSVEGKVALVTGGSRGIGLMIARGFVENGVKTYISSRKAEACDQAVKELSQYGECIALPADMSSMDEIERVAKEISAKEQKLDILVNNAGANWGAPFAEFPENGWDKVMELNVKSPFFLTQKLLPLLQAAASNADPARVINVGSINGINTPRVDTFSYPASKAAIHHLTKILAAHLTPENITVNAIAPGPFETKMMAGTLAARRQEILDNVPLGRTGEDEDMAGIALYLSSRAGAYVSGTVIPVDGGSLVNT